MRHAIIKKHHHYKQDLIRVKLNAQLVVNIPRPNHVYITGIHLITLSPRYCPSYARSIVSYKMYSMITHSVCLYLICTFCII